MYRLLSALIFVILSTACFSQKIPLINSGEVLARGIELYDSGKFADAIRMFETIPARDTNYTYMLYELALAYNADKQYPKALEVCDKGLKNPGPFHSDFLRLQAIATDKNGEFEKSVGLFKKASEKFPTDFGLLYNLGITYFNNKQPEKAADIFFKVLQIDPFHTGSHLHLGLLSILQGRKTHAMLSLGMYIAIASSDNGRLVLLNNCMDNQVTDEGTMAPFGTNAADKLDQVIKAKFAMEKSFKSNHPVNAPVVRQFELFFQQMDLIAKDTDDRYVKFYLPIYKALKDQEQSEAFIYHILTSTGNNDVKKWLARNDKALSGFYNTVNTKLKAVRERLDPAVFGFAKFGFDKPVMAYFDDNQKVDALGESANDVRKGRWVFFHDNGVISAEGSYDDAGTKTGSWKYYFNTGNQRTLEVYNKEKSEITLFYPDGVTKREHYFQVNRKTEGSVDFYARCGMIRESLQYGNGQREGKGQTFYPDGKTKMSYEYRGNNGTGEFINYYENGAVSGISRYKDDKLNGKYIGYHPNGKIKMEGDYLNDEVNGIWKYYYSNGQLERTGNYTNGMGTGEWLYYSRSGQLTEKRLFDEKGRFDGENTHYHNDKVSYVYTYKKDVVVKQVAFDSGGKELYKASSNDGTLTLKTFFTTNELRSESPYKKGVQHGLAKTYHRNGKLMSEYTYENGNVIGTAKEYFETGKVKYILNYENNLLHGYFQEFFENGKVKQEGWFQDGERQQQWLTWYSDGTLETDYYYLSDSPYGEGFNFGVDGKLFTKSVFDRDGFIERHHYNTKGEIVLTERPVAKAATVTQKYPNKKDRSVYQATCGEYTGSFARFYPNGTPHYSFEFSNGKKYGRYISHYENGKPAVQGQFLNDNEEGMWTWSRFDGSKDSEGRYRDGEQDSVWNYYYPDGKLAQYATYVNGKRHGVARYFTPDGQPAMEKQYDMDDIIAYRTADAQGNFGEWSKFTGNETIVAKYPGGKIAFEEGYKDGTRHGVRKIYYADGKVMEEYTYENGNRTGTYATYFRNGKPREKAVYKDDELEGTFEVFNADGTLAKTESYRGGTRNGESTIFVKGQKSQALTYWDGIPEF